MSYKKRQLQSGRVVFETYTDAQGRPRFYEYFDSRTGAKRLAYGSYWDGRNRAKSLGLAAGFLDTMELIEFNLEEFQMSWKPYPTNGNLIILHRAFAHLPPRVGDQLIEFETQKVFTVTHVPRAKTGNPWNLSVLLSDAPTPGFSLNWIGDARERNLVDFHADAGHPDMPLKATETSGDVGTATPGSLRPTITYLLIRQEPYTIDGPPFGSKKELNPRLREQFNDPASPQKVISILGQRMENLVRFSCIHPRAETAYGLAEWFKVCMNMRSSSLEANGVNKIFYWSMGAKERRGKPGDDAAVCDTSYLIITEELSIREDSAIRKLTTVARRISATADIGEIHIEGLTEPGDDGYLTPFTGMYDESGNLVHYDLDIQDLNNTGEPQ